MRLKPRRLGFAAGIGQGQPDQDKASYNQHCPRTPIALLANKRPETTAPGRWNLRGIGPVAAVVAKDG